MLNMATDATTSSALQELIDVVDALRHGVRDAAAIQIARQRLDCQREALREKIGTVEVAVELIRDARDL